MIQCSSISSEAVAQIHSIAKAHKQIVVCLDSHLTREYILIEFNAHAPLRSVGSHCVVSNAILDDLPKELFPDCPWDPGFNPKTAIREFQKLHPEFEIDQGIHQKNLILAAQDGHLLRKR